MNIQTEVLAGTPNDGSMIAPREFTVPAQLRKRRWTIEDLGGTTSSSINSHRPGTGSLIQTTVRNMFTEKYDPTVNYREKIVELKNLCAGGSTALGVAVEILVTEKGFNRKYLQLALGLES